LLADPSLLKSCRRRYTVGGALFVRAQREALAGEELTISYCNPLDSVHDRRSALWKTHAFVCACELCEAGDDSAQYAEAAAAASVSRTDAARQRQHAAAYAALDTRSLCALALMRTNHALHVARASEAIGQTTVAADWHRKAREQFSLHYGASDELYRQFLKHRECRLGS
jgi:hypothetical protein